MLYRTKSIHIFVSTNSAGVEYTKVVSIIWIFVLKKTYLELQGIVDVWVGVIKFDSLRCEDVFAVTTVVEESHQLLPRVSIAMRHASNGQFGKEIIYCLSRRLSVYQSDYFVEVE